MDEQIKTNLALEVAQMALDKATLKAQIESLQQELIDTKKQLDTLTEQEKGE